MSIKSLHPTPRKVESQLFGKQFQSKIIKHYSAVFVLSISILANINLASAAQGETLNISSVVGDYLGFDLADVSSDQCRQGLPDYPKVMGLPNGMYSSGCSIYGYPELIGEFLLEFPIADGWYKAELTVTDGSNGGSGDTVLQISSVVAAYLGFDLADVSSDQCRQGLPDYPKVTGLPNGMYSSGCSIYGYPESIGKFSLEFPIDGGWYKAELTVTDGSNGGSDDTVLQISSVVGAYLGFDLADVSSDQCRQGLPDYPKVTGLPNGMNSSGCSIYGYPESIGKFSLEFPIDNGWYKAELTVADSLDDDGNNDDNNGSDDDNVASDDDGTGGLETVCVASGTGTDYPVGPDQIYTNISDVPWNSLGAGDTVRIFHKPTPYYEKIIISTDGSEENPITVCGVAGANGERPIIDGDGASNGVNDAGTYGTYRPNEGLAVVLLFNRVYGQKVHNIVIDGLHIKNGKNTFNYSRVDGSSSAYISGAACIRVQAADNIVIRNNLLENCGNGIFAMSQDYNEGSLTRNLLIEGNYLHGHGQINSDRQHALYIQAIGVIYQYNHFGPNAFGSGGVTLKERAAGSVIRYNWFDTGSARMLDIVEVQDAPSWYLEQSYRDWAEANNEAIDPERLLKVQAAEAAYKNTYVYGNFFQHIGSKSKAGKLIHYGYDNSPRYASKGTLHFYNNTMSIKNDQNDSWRIRLFDIRAYDEKAGVPAEETIEAFNNLIYFSNETAGSAASSLCFGSTSGTINLGINWVSDHWSDNAAFSDCYSNEQLMPTINGLGSLINSGETNIPIKPNTLAPNDIPSIRNQAQAASSATVDYPVMQQYSRHRNATTRSTLNDLGAAEIDFTAGDDGNNDSVVHVSVGDDIQSAINAASDGATIKVAAGSFNGSLVIADKTLTLLGGYSADFTQRDPSQYVTSLQGSHDTAVVSVLSSDGSMIDGFTISGGQRGVLVRDNGNYLLTSSNITISNNIIENNGVREDSFYFSGGGIKSLGSHITISNNTVRNNIAGRGAGISALSNSEFDISNNIIENNYAYGDHAGGLYISGNGIIVDNIVQGNRIEFDIAGGYGWGGGITTIPTNKVNNDIHFSGNVWTKNYSKGPGAGVFIDDGSIASFKNELIYNNVSLDSRPGAELYIDDSGDQQPSIVNIEDSIIYGGGIVINNSTAIINNSTIWSPHSTEAFRLHNNAILNLSNSVFPDIDLGGEGNSSEQPQFTNPDAGDFTLLVQ